MALQSVSVSYLIVLGVSVVSFIFGWLWYTVLFGKIWSKEMGYGGKEMKKDKEKGMAKSMILNFIGTFVMVYVIAMFVGLLSVNNFGDAAMLGFWIWLGFFAATTLLGDVLWEMRSWKLFFINGVYWLVNLIISAGILSVWK